MESKVRTGIVKEKGIVGSRIFHEPMHRSEDVRFGRLAHWILLIIGQDHHVFSRVAEIVIQVCGHVLDIVNTPTQGSALVEVIDAD